MEARKVPLKNWAALFFCCIAFFLAGGIVFGFNALKPSLEDLHIFEHKCARNESLPCAKQTAALDHIMEFAGPAINLLMWPTGILVDYLGPRRVVIVGSIGLVGSGIGAAFCLTPAYQDALQYLFAAFGECGVLLFFGFMTGIMQLNQGDMNMGIINTNALLTVLWDLSTFVFVILAKLTAYLSLRTLFIGLFATGGAISLLTALIFLPDRPAKVTLAPLRFYLLPTVVLQVLYTVSWLIGESFFVGSVGPQALWIMHGDKRASDRLEDVFNFILPCLAPATLAVITMLHSRTKRRLHVRVLVGGAIGLLCMGLASIRVRDVQYATYVLFVFWRIYTSAQLYDNIADTPFASYFGQFVGPCLTIGGAFGLLSMKMEDALADTYDGSPRVIYLIQGAVMAATCLGAAYGFSPRGVKRSEERLANDPEKQRLLTNYTEEH